MTRLLHILSQRPGRSGSGIFLEAMVREAAQRDYHQHVIAFGPPSTTAAEVPFLNDQQFSPVVFPNQTAAFNIPGNSDVMPYPSTRFSDLTPDQIEQYLESARQVMLQVKTTFQPDLVHTHHLFLASALVREVFHDVPVIATAHNAALRLCQNNPHLVPRLLPGIQSIDRICVLTPQSRLDTLEQYHVDPERIAVTQAGYRNDYFHVSTDSKVESLNRLRTEFGIELPPDITEASIVTFIGRLSTSKGIPFLLKAFEALQDEFSPTYLLLVGAAGSGEDGRRMGQLAKQANSTVIHVGAVPHAAVAPFLHCSDLFVLPSLFEGLPLTMLEALATGCRCVVSGLPTICSWVPPEWLERGRIRLVPKLKTLGPDTPVGDDVERFVSDLAASLRAGLRQPWPWKNKRDLSLEMKNHTWPVVFDRYEAVYRQLLATKVGSAKDLDLARC